MLNFCYNNGGTLKERVFLLRISVTSVAIYQARYDSRWNKSNKNPTTLKTRESQTSFRCNVFQSIETPSIRIGYYLEVLDSRSRMLSDHQLLYDKEGTWQAAICLFRIRSDPYTITYTNLYKLAPYFTTPRRCLFAGPWRPPNHGPDYIAKLAGISPHIGRYPMGQLDAGYLLPSLL